MTTKEFYYVAYRDTDGQKEYYWPSLSDEEYKTQRETVNDFDRNENAFNELSVDDIIDRGFTGLFYYLNYEVAELEADEMRYLIYDQDAEAKIEQGINASYWFRQLK